MIKVAGRPDWRREADQRKVVRDLIDLADRLLVAGRLAEAELAADAALLQARRYAGELP